jgi:hypothetical protein
MMADAPREEQRRRPRVAHRLLVRYRPPTEGIAEWLVSPLRDFSSGGARFLSEHPFAAGQTFELQLLLPAAQDPVTLKARVAWTKPAQMRMTELGVTFDPGDAAMQRLIDATVEHFLQKQKAV